MLVAYTFPPFGRETVIPLAIAAGIPWAYVLLSVFVEDFLVAVFVILNMDLLHRLPVIGRFVQGAMKRSAGFMERRTWFRRAAFLAVAAYPLIPTPFKGTGTFSESIIATAVGLDKKRALVAVSIGAAGADILTTLLSSLLIQTLLIPLFH